MLWLWYYIHLLLLKHEFVTLYICKSHMWVSAGTYTHTFSEEYSLIQEQINISLIIDPFEKLFF